jgi:hypothetical protein
MPLRVQAIRGVYPHCFSTKCRERRLADLKSCRPEARAKPASPFDSVTFTLHAGFKGAFISIDFLLIGCLLLGSGLLLGGLLIDGGLLLGSLLFSHRLFLSSTCPPLSDTAKRSSGRSSDGSTFACIPGNGTDGGTARRPFGATAHDPAAWRWWGWLVVRHWLLWCHRLGGLGLLGLHGRRHGIIAGLLFRPGIAVGFVLFQLLRALASRRIDHGAGW